MEKIIDFSKDVNSLCNTYPELVDVLVGLGFKPLANPVLRKTVGSHITITKASNMLGVPMEKILFALAEKGFAVTGESNSEKTETAASAADPHEPGHAFLARMGKTRLRPGGKEATDWLLENANLTADSKVLEVACNMGTTLIGVVEKYGCKATGVDLSEEALGHAAENVRKHGLENKINLLQGNALDLPFPDNTFDVVINEAMLTMLVGEKKDKALAEYYRVLKPGGKLLTQDVCLRTGDVSKQNELVQQISRAINVHVEPLTPDAWNGKFETQHFRTEVRTGAMTLLDPEGMVRDEGEARAVTILENAMKPENAPRFEKMFHFFNYNKENLGYIAIVSTKTE